MALAANMMYAECALILLLSVPIYVPYRRQLMEWVHYSPRLWTLRVIIVCVHAFVAILLADTYLRLNRITLQIEGIQAAHAKAILHATNAGVAQGAGLPIGGAAAPAVDASGNISNLNDLFSAKFRGQRDFYVLAFTLFCSTVLFNLHMVLIKSDKYRAQKNELKQKLKDLSKKMGSIEKSSPTGDAELVKDVTDEPSSVIASFDTTEDRAELPLETEQPTVAQSAKAQANKVAETITNTVKNATSTVSDTVKSATTTVSDKMGALLQHQAHQTQPELNVPSEPEVVNAGVIAPAESHIHQRTVYTTEVTNE